MKTIMGSVVKRGAVYMAVIMMLFVGVNMAWAVPTANNQVLTVPPNIAAPGKVITLSYSGAVSSPQTIVTQPDHGTLTPYGIWFPSYFYYLPDTDYQGPDPFTWTVSDSSGTSTIATYSITVANAAPVANPQLVTVAEGAVRFLFNLSYSHSDAKQHYTFQCKSFTHRS